MDSITAPTAATPLLPPSQFAHLKAQLSAVLATGLLPVDLPNPPVRGPLSLLVANLSLCLLFIHFLYSILITVFYVAHPTFFLAPGDSTGALIFVGGILFLLLSFTISFRFEEHREAFFKWHEFSLHIQQFSRFVLQIYAPATRHRGDIRRILDHLLAYPVALNQHLRQSHANTPLLRSILNQDDLKSLLASSPGPLHHRCYRVIRDCMASAECDLLVTFQPQRGPKRSARRVVVDHAMRDQLDLGKFLGGSELARFYHSTTGVNFPRLVLLIWLALLPICIVGTTGYSTPLLAVIIAYSTAKPLLSDCALNDPFGQDPDIPLNRMTAQIALDLLQMFGSDSVTLRDVVHKSTTAQTSANHSASSQRHSVPQLNFESPSSPPVIALRFKPAVTLPLIAFVVWILIVVLWTFTEASLKGSPWVALLAGRGRGSPIFTKSMILNTSYMVMYVYLRSWARGSYDLSSHALDEWAVNLRTRLDDTAMQVAMTCRPGLWHPNDRDRIFSFLVAFPFSLREELRESRNLSALRDVLSARDLEELGNAPNMPRHCLNVVFEYLNALDSHDAQVRAHGGNPTEAAATLLTNARAMESSASECTAISKYSRSVLLTNHVSFFVSLWLILSPLSLVGNWGLFSFLCLIPIAYSVLRMLQIGDELAHPYGHDEHDVPMDVLCNEMKESIMNISNVAQNGPSHFVTQSSGYCREHFELALQNALLRSKSDRNQLTWWRSARLNLERFVRVNVWLLIGVIGWSFLAVTTSYTLSFLLGKEARSQCHAWCSPLDVPIEFWFLMLWTSSHPLYSRPPDAGRYFWYGQGPRALVGLYRFRENPSDEFCSLTEGYGVSLLRQVQSELRGLTNEIVQCFKPNTWHNGDIERLVAHLVQLPIAMKASMIGEDLAAGDQDKGLLTDSDKRKLTEAPCAIDYILNLVETYILTWDGAGEEFAVHSEERRPSAMTGRILMRLYAVRVKIREALSIQRFPCPSSYSRHCSQSTYLWLALVPLSLTSLYGFSTILWNTIYSYAILAVHFMCNKRFMDPYGNDRSNYRIRAMCDEMIPNILEGLTSTDWGCRLRVSP